MIPAISLQKAQACNHFWNVRCLMIKRCGKWFLARDGLRRRCSACLRGAHRSRPSRSHAASARVIRLSLAMLSLSRLASMVRGSRRLGAPCRLAVITPPNRGLRVPVGRRRARFEIPLADHARNRSAEPPPRLVLSPHPRSRLSRRGRSNGRAEGLPSVDDLAQTGDDSPQFSPRFWTCRFGIAGGHSPPSAVGWYAYASPWSGLPRTSRIRGFLCGTHRSGRRCLAGFRFRGHRCSSLWLRDSPRDKIVSAMSNILRARFG